MRRTTRRGRGRPLEELVLLCVLLFGCLALSSRHRREPRTESRGNAIISVIETFDPPPALPIQTPVLSIEALGVGVLPRQRWRAREPNGATDSLEKLSRITIHHQGGPVFKTDDLATTIRRLRGMQDHHQNDRGWVDIGYHFMVDRGGRIWQGRRLGSIGAHAGNRKANEANLGVLVMGNFDLQEPSKKQVSALEKLLDAVRGHADIAPEDVLTHNEMRLSTGQGSTECPGKHLTEVIRTYRDGCE